MLMENTVSSAKKLLVYIGKVSRISKMAKEEKLKTKRMKEINHQSENMVFPTIFPLISKDVRRIINTKTPKGGFNLVHPYCCFLKHVYHKLSYLTISTQVETTHTISPRRTKFECQAPPWAAI